MKKYFIQVSACALLAACSTTTPVLHPDHSKLADAHAQVARAHQVGGDTCAPQLMAKAQSELYWAQHELTDEQNPGEFDTHVANADKYAGEVIRLCYKPAPPPPPPPAKPEIIRLEGVHFVTNSAQLTPYSSAILDKAVDILNKRPGIQVEIDAYTSATGTAAYNLKLSERRAISVHDYLVSHGIAANRLSMHGYGEAQPIASNATAEGRAKNRRVELKVLR